MSAVLDSSRPPVSAAVVTQASATPTRLMQLANFALFQLAWFAAVLGAAHDRPVLGTLAVVAVIAWHLSVSARPMQEAQLLAWVCALGFAIETAAVWQGHIVYASGQPIAWLPPYWMIALWGLLAIALNVTMRWMRGRPVLAAVLGAVAGPASFVSGVRLGAAHFLDSTPALITMACVWAVMMPLLIWLAVRHDGVTQPATHDV
jgi:hypothetical protein